MATSRKGWTLPAVLGGLGLMVGAFAPAVVVDVYGEVSLHDVAESQAVLIVLAGAAACTGGVLRRPTWVMLAAVAAWIGVLLPLIRNWMAPEPGFFESLGDSVTGAVGDELGDVALQMTSLSWGGVPLLLGVLLVSLAAWRAR